MAEETVEEVVLSEGSLKELNSRDPQRQYIFVKGSETFPETGIETMDSEERLYAFYSSKKPPRPPVDALKKFTKVLREKGYDGAVHMRVNIRSEGIYVRKRVGVDDPQSVPIWKRRSSHLRDVLSGRCYVREYFGCPIVRVQDSD